MLKADVVCIGSATLDTFLTIDLPFNKIKPGYKVLVQNLEKHSGGGATNAAASLKKLGIKTKVLTKLGNDHDAAFIQAELNQLKIKNLCQNKSKYNTDSATIISSKKQRDRIIYVNKGASTDLQPKDFKPSQLRTKWIYLATLMGKSFQTAKIIIKNKQKTKILFNPSRYLAKKGKTYLKPLLKHTNILVLNKQEAQSILKTTNQKPKTLLQQLQKLGPESIIITNGPQTLYALNQNALYSLQPPKVPVVHTAGSGDAFTAAFLAGIIKHYSFPEALKLGQANATSVIQHLGTKNKLLTETEAQSFLKKHKIKITQNELK